MSKTINEIEKSYIRKLKEYQHDWNRYARDILGVKLDKAQQEILYAIQQHNRVSVRSGNARGKDYVAAVASICFLNLYSPSKVINTAPTGRQAISIMMAEIAKIYQQARKRSDAQLFLLGRVLSNQVKFRRPDRYLLAFKARDKNIENWTGFHSPNLMVVITEASGIEEETFSAVESILTGNSKLVIVFNPNKLHGETYRSVTDTNYVRFKLSSLDAPNVVQRKIVIPGQVDYAWVVDKISRWCIKISEEEANPTEHDFQFEGQWYRPNDLFLVKVMGEFPRESQDKLIPLNWIEAAIHRWHDKHEAFGSLSLGVDVAGMGRDMTVFCHRRGNIVEKFDHFSQADHMVTVGRIRSLLLGQNDQAFVDATGEGAGVVSRLLELGVRAVAVKFGEGAKNFSDWSGQRSFANMRAYCYWAVRDALDPHNEFGLCLPPNDELVRDLNEPKWSVRSDGTIILEEKDKIKQRLGRSPDFGDSLALTFYPNSTISWPGTIEHMNHHIGIIENEGDTPGTNLFHWKNFSEW